MARAMITRYGMTDDFDMVALETVNNAYLGGDASLACSERTACLLYTSLKPQGGNCAVLP